MSGKTWQRVGGFAGVLFVALFVANFFTPSTPDADDPSSSLAPSIADDRNGHALSIYLDGAAIVVFLVFLTALWSLLRRAEAETGASTLAIVGGIVLAATLLVADGVYLALVQASDEAREATAVRALFELDNAIFVPAGFAIAVLYAGIALSAIPTRSLPAWLGWSAAGFAGAFLVSLLGVFSSDNEGGALGIVFFIALMLQFLWVLAASVVMLGRRRQATTVPREAVTA